MPRKARRESSTGVYHIMLRGNNKEWILKQDKLKQMYKTRMLEVITRSELELYAWCIMDNHVHMVIKSDKKHIAPAMKAINSYYARKYNMIMKRTGHALQDRYKSEVVEDDKYFKGVIRYVHMNPVKAHIVKAAEDYRWSSYLTYIEGYNNHSINIMNAYFHNDINCYKAFHQKNDDTEYIDVIDTINALRLERAQNVIQTYCNKYQIKSIYDIHRNKTLRDEIIREIARTSKLQLTKVAKLCGLSYSTVYEIVNKIDM